MLVWWAAVVASTLCFMPIPTWSVAIPRPLAVPISKVYELEARYGKVTELTPSSPKEAFAWVAVFTVGALFFALRVVLTWRHVRTSEQIGSPEILAEVADIGTSVGVREMPLVLTSDKTDSAFATGIFNPAIVLPRKAIFESPQDQRRAVLCHELLHIRRRDHWFVVMMDLWFCLFIWNPLAWFVRNLAFNAMEEANDERTVNSGLVEKAAYIRALVSGTHPMVGAPIARFHGQSSLRARIEALANGKPQRSIHWAIVASAFMMLVGAPLNLEAMPVLAEPGNPIRPWQLVYASSHKNLPLPMTMRRDGTGIRPLFGIDGPQVGQVVPSPDGTKIAYIRGVMANYDVFMSDLDGSNEVLVAGRDETEVQPHFSPDGTKIVYSAKLNSRWQIFVYDIADRSTEQVSDPDFKEYEARWHPNSQRLIFSSDRSGQQKIWSRNLNGSDLFQISQGDTFETGGCYSRDGRYAFYMSTRAGGFDIYRLDLVKGYELKLTHAMGDDGEAEVSPDNRWIYFTTGRNRKVQIARMRLDGSDETVFTRTEGTWPKFRPISGPSQPAR